MLWPIRKSGEVATLLAEVKPTHGVDCVPSAPVSLMIGQPSVMAWPHLLEGMA